MWFSWYYKCVWHMDLYLSCLRFLFISIEVWYVQGCNYTISIKKNVNITAVAKMLGSICCSIGIWEMSFWKENRNQTYKNLRCVNINRVYLPRFHILWANRSQFNHTFVRYYRQIPTGENIELEWGVGCQWFVKSFL